MKRLLPLLLLITACAPSNDTKREQLLDFLYASMPLPDSVDYTRDYWLQNIDCALAARDEMPWGKTIPEREWLHFVLPVRVNNENLDSARMVFYPELKERVRGLSMSEAILEVNHWCHERVTYTPSDERTSAPLATIRTAYGRCGEESTLLVTALRSVGIPARQVYTPRWAHTDDNHAWVEAWADGEWHFLGACEPEPVLDLGWFNAPASRAMLMHTKAFGQYDGPEEVMQRTRCYTEIDVTAHYAPVSRAYVQVTDANGQPVNDATVEFKIYNYAEFYTVSTKAVDSQGIASLQAGLGDLFVWAYRYNNPLTEYGYAVCHVNEQPDTLQVILNHKVEEAFTFDVEIVPPVERNTLPTVSEEQRAQNQQRLAYEDSLRNAYITTFDTSSNDLLVASRGNHQTIRDFLAQADNAAKAEGLLRAISAKDLRDITPAVLADHYQHTTARYCQESDYYNYLLNPRVLNEQLTPYKQYLQQNVPEELRAGFKTDVNKIIDWVRQHIAIDEASNPQQLRMTPIGVWQSRRCDAVSRNIFFVSLARSMGHLAYIDRVNGSVMCKQLQQGEWQYVELDLAEEEEIQPYYDLTLTYQPTTLLPDPKYYTHFTLSQLDYTGHLRLLEYAEEDSYRTLSAHPLRLVGSSNHLLITGTRMANGSVLVHGEMIYGPMCSRQTAPIVLRQATEGLQVIGSFNSENLYLDATTGQTKSILSTTGRGYYIFAIIAPNNEPTSHALRDIVLCKEQIEKWGGKLMLIFRDEAERERFRLTDYPELPSNVVFGSDIDDQMLTELCQSLHLSSNPRQATLPVFVIADTFNRIVWYKQGYTIGLGEQLVKAIEAIKD